MVPCATFTVPHYRILFKIGGAESWYQRRNNLLTLTEY
jgi:hypothetical protein